MTIAIVQLSDIHFSSAEDPAVARAPMIGAAIAAEIAPDVETCVIAVCGDATYSGKKPQFDVLRGFLTGIESSLQARRASIKLVRALVPGNHDCDFGGDQEARDVLLKGVDGQVVPAKSTLDVLLKPLANYFSFVDDYCGSSNAISQDHPLYHTLDVVDGDAVLRIHLFNTAWASSIHEKVGALKFPLDAIASLAGGADCSLAILHHPLQWFAQPHAMRPLRDRIAELAAVVLVNHEHTSEGRDEALILRAGQESTKTLYVAGGVIQDTDHADLCSFNVLHLNLTAKRIRITQHMYVHADVPYFSKSAEEEQSIAEHQLSVGPHGDVLSSNWLGFLRDPGAPIRHPRRDPRSPITLDEIYLYPDLWEVESGGKADGRRQVKSDRVAERVLSAPRVLVTGGDKSGRTSLLKRLYAEAIRRGKTPLFVDGGKVPKDRGKLRNHLRRLVEEQYQNLSADAFEQRDPSLRVVLVDDLHRMRFSPPVRDSMLKELEQDFGSVVVCSNDILRIEELRERSATGSHLWEYAHFGILGFGEHLRERFVQRWLRLAVDDDASEQDVDRETDRICGLLNAVIKKQLLPTYPLFILLVLQQSDIAHASVQSGSFGKLFEGVVTAMLNTSTFNAINISDKYFYLAAFAKELFDRQRACLTEDEAIAWHRVYWEGIDLHVDFHGLVQDLHALGILTASGREVRFRYAYFYCFFMAYSLFRRIHESEARAVVKQLAGQLHHRLSAEIVLFLAHLTSDPIVLDAMVETCDRLFANAQPATLGGDVNSLNRLGEVAAAIEVSEDTAANRKALKEVADAEIADRLAASDSEELVVAPVADSDQIRQLFDIHAAYKSIQILGQALRNVAGSATRERKVEVATKVLGLSRRLLGLHLGFLDSQELEDLMNDMAAAHREQQPGLDKSDVGRQVCRDIWGLAQFICFMVIRHTTLSMGSANLAPTMGRVLNGNEPIEAIMRLAFEMEIPNEFPKKLAVETYGGVRKNGFAASIVQIAVAHHFYLHVEPTHVRQSVCDQLGIKLLPAVLDASRKKLL